jgi:uncharacterized protein YyaL (SSP411 family)
MLTSRLEPVTAVFNSIIHPTQMLVILRDSLDLKNKQQSNKTHLASAIDWLCRSQDQCGGNGCSASYGFNGGWAPPYPETTGYIISTFLGYAAFTRDELFVERAKKMGDWEIEIQLPSGAVRGGVGINDYPDVFNTGMVIFGWTDLYSHTGYERYLSASVRAADWLCSNLDNEGRWSSDTYNGIPHAYHSRVSWSLLEVYKRTKDIRYKDAAIRNLNWVISLVQEGGWINEMGFFEGETPVTHTIAYTLRGLLECSFFLDEELKLKTQNIVMRAAERIMFRYEVNKNNPYSTPKFLPGRLNSKWQSGSTYSCLTGNAQMAIMWLKIYQVNSDARYLNAALKILDQLKEVQNLNSSNPGIRGGIAGSYPIWGGYMPFSYPNWAAKFFADALMLLETIMSKIQER